MTGEFHSGKKKKENARTGEIAKAEFEQIHVLREVSEGTQLPCHELQSIYPDKQWAF